MRASACTRPVLLVLVSSLVATFVPASPAADAEVAGDRIGYEFGIALAMAGERTRAESVFVSMLSRFPGDAAAFTNLGNLKLLNGDPELALAFYARARETDSTDAGIVLDQATSLLLLGEDAEAVTRARVALDMTGSPASAASLLGLRFPDEAGIERGAGGSRLTREEVLELLRIAVGRVPADSTRPAAPDSTTRSGSKSPVWRPAGPRAGGEALPAHLYWKR